MIELIPVLDIRGGVAVSGKSGKRHEYTPLKTVYHPTSDTTEIASAMPFKRLYIADLDGITSQNPDIETIKQIAFSKEIMVDIGVRSSADLEIFHHIRCQIILGTETLEDLDILTHALDIFGKRIIVSIDIKKENVLSSFLPNSPEETYDTIRQTGVEEFIFLDITSVGTLRNDFSFIKDLNKTSKILVGGGITSKDLEVLERMKVDGALVGTALHKGLIGCV